MNMDDEQGHPFDLGHHQTNHHKVMAQLLWAIATQGDRLKYNYLEYMVGPHRFAV